VRYLSFQQVSIDDLKLFRKVFGRSCREDLTSAAKANVSVNALARQRAHRDDTALDSN
jgi:hypothetical protein